MIEIDDFCNYLLIDKHYSSNTIESYKRDLAKFYEYIKKDFKNIDKNDVKDYLKFINNMNERSVARNISTLIISPISC